MASKRTHALAACLPVVMTVSACATGAAGSVSIPTDRVTIGLIAPTTGFSANYGPEALAGVELALREHGDTVAGKPIKIVTIDENVLDPSETLERVKHGVESEGVGIVLGPVFGSSQYAVQPYLAQRDIPMFSFLGGESSMAEQGNAFIWPGADDQTAKPLGTYAGEELHYKRIATLAPDYAYGHSTMKGVTSAFEKTGGKVVQQQWVPLGTTDMLQYATALDRDVDALALWLVPTDAAAFLREYRNLGIKVPLLLFQGVFDPTYQEVGPELVGEIGLNEYNPLLTTPVNTQFLKEYEAFKGGIPNQTTAFAYTVTDNLLQGLTVSRGDPAASALHEALGGRRLDTVIGAASYDAKGVASSNRVIVRSARQGDRFVWLPVKEYTNVGQAAG